MHIQREVTICRPPETVFRWIEKPELAARWQPDVGEYEITRAVDGVVGSEFREVARDAKGSMELRGRITAYIRNVLMEFDVKGRGVHVTARYTLAPSDAGTQLRVDTRVRIGGWLSWLVGPFARRKVSEQQRRELEQLRSLCELAPVQPPPAASGTPKDPA